MTTPPIVTLDDDFIGYLEMLTDKATGGDWEHRLGMIRTMPDSDGYVPVAVAPSAPKNWRAQRDLNLDYIAAAKPETMRALLAERAELKNLADAMQTFKADMVLDAERYRWLRVASAGDDSAEPHGLCVELWDTGLGHEITGDELDAAIDAAMQS